MSEDRSADLPVSYDQRDLLVDSVRWAGRLAALVQDIGPLSATLIEFVSGHIPGQRVDRLADFAHQLHDRIAGLEEQFKSRLGDEQFALLAERVMEEAARANTAERRRSLSELLARGVTRDEAHAQDASHLLRLLTEMDDNDVVLLGYYALSDRAAVGDKELAQYRETHAAVVEARMPHSNSSQEERDRWGFFDHRRRRLASLGVLAIGQTSGPRPVERFTLTAVGRRLLTEVGCAVKEPKA